MTPEEITKAVELAIDKKLGQFYIDRETHYQDHLFLRELRKWSEEVKGTVLRTTLKFVVASLIGLLILGFILWGKKHLVQ